MSALNWAGPDPPGAPFDMLLKAHPDRPAAARQSAATRRRRVGATRSSARGSHHPVKGLPRKAQGSTAAATALTPPVEPARKASSPWSSAAVGGPQSPLRAYKERVPVVGLQHHARYPTTTRTHLLHHTPQTQPPGRPSALYRQTDYGGFPRLPSSPLRHHGCHPLPYPAHHRCRCRRCRCVRGGAYYHGGARPQRRV